MKLDLHVHTIYSAIPGYPFLRDSFNRFEDIHKVAGEKGIDGVGITDHNTIKGALKLKEYVKQKKLNISIIVGEEIRTLSGDVIALYIDERIPHGMTIEETLDRIRDFNGLSIAPHPYTRRGVSEKNVRTYRFNGIETMNSCCSFEVNQKAKLLAAKLGLVEVGGSDAHRPEVLGNSVTQVPDGYSIRESLEKGRTRVHGKITPTLSFIQKVILRLKQPRYIFCNPL